VGKKLLSVVITVLFGVGLAVPSASALTYSTYRTSSTSAAPNVYYNRNSASNTLNGTVVWYYSFGNNRYRTQMRGGSGTGHTNDCTSNQGPLPDGTYGRGDGDSNSRFTFQWKQTSANIVLGFVWYLGNKRCNGPGSNLRTALFIHSQGFSGWSPSNYASLGCIKIDQDDRGYIANQYLNAVDNTNGRLMVYS
jgi:hypothetical protein